MKNGSFRMLLALCLLAPFFCQAELLIYKGSMKMHRLGDGGESRQTYKVLLVLERATGEIARINYFSASGLKLYTVEQAQGFHALAAVGARGRTNTVLAQAETSVNESNQVTATSVFITGAQAKLTVNRGSTAFFPKVLSWAGRGVAPSSRTADSQVWEETGILAFYESATVASNKNGETLAQAEARLIAGFQSGGYREFMLK